MGRLTKPSEESAKRPLKGKRKWNESRVQLGERTVEETNVTDQTYLQIRARRSPLAVAKSFPVGLGATDMTTQPSASVQQQEARCHIGDIVGKGHAERAIQNRIMPISFPRNICDGGRKLVVLPDFLWPCSIN